MSQRAQQKILENEDMILKSVQDSIVPLRKKLADLNEETFEARRLLPENAKLFKESGFLKIISPYRDGRSPDFLLAQRVIEEMATACPSSAWCLASYMSFSSWVLHFFPDEAVAEVQPKGVNNIICGVSAPTGKVTSVLGGYRLSGRWRWASGCEAADWVMLTAKNTDDDKNEVMSFLVPTGKCEIESTWSPVGLHGTGSKDVVLNDHFIPEHRGISFSRVFSKVEEEQLKQSPILYLPAFMANWLMAQVCSGVAVRVLEEAKSRLAQSFIPHEGRPQSKSPLALAELATAQAQIDAAQALNQSIGEKLNEHMEQKKSFTTLERAKTRLDMAYAFALNGNVIDRIEGLLGVKVVNPSSELTRFFLDYKAMKAHPAFDIRVAKELFGRVLVGEKPQTSYY